jgi:PncC family amidohydrolase
MDNAERLVKYLNGRSLYLVTAESCTAGLAAETIARIPGASACFWGSFVCYSIQAKIQMLGIREEILKKFGPVSKETAQAMALGALERSGADVAVSVTGLAGPGGNDSNLPVGTVWIATALRSEIRSNETAKPAETAKFLFSGGRNSVRRQAAEEALKQIIKRLLEQENIYALCQENSNPKI